MTAVAAKTPSGRCRGRSDTLTWPLVGLATAIAMAGAPAALAETMSGALAKGYLGNPLLGSARAATRAADEGVSQAKAGFRPRVSVDVVIGRGYQQGIDIDGPVKGSVLPRSAGATVAETLFDGGRTLNNVRRAETTVLAEREALRTVEQRILRDSATAYMNVLRDTAILDLQVNNVAVLREQLRHTRDYFEKGYVSPTDVAQAAAALSLARADYATARSALQTSIAEYRRIIGAEPVRLEAARPLGEMLPRTLAEAITTAVRESPAIASARQRVDIALLQAKIEEGRLYPSVEAFAQGQAARDTQGYIGDLISRGDRFVLGGANVRADLPIYNGGEVYAAVRRAKEREAQARLRVDLEIRDVQAAVASAWARLQAARQLVPSSRVAIKASESALDGVREEADAGKRTTLDVLRAQRDLLRARVALVGAQRDYVVAGYDLAAATGLLSAVNLRLAVAPYDPSVHLRLVEDRWYGLRTP